MFTLIRIAAAVISIAISLLPYVLTAYALYKMGGACGIAKPQKAFVPVLNAYQLGQIADAHRRRNENQKPLHAKILLWTQIILLALGVLLFVQLMITAVASLALIMADPLLDTVPDAVASSLASMLPVFLAAIAISAVFTVFYYIAHFKVFQLYDPENAVIYLVLCILFPIAQPIILLLLARKEPRFLDTPVFTTDYSL